MDRTWVLTANRSGASLFEMGGSSKALRRLKDIPHPEGRLQNKEIGTDQPGRAFDSLGQGRHSMGTSNEPTEQLAMQFARDLATLLNKGRTTHAYDKVVLVAEPRFLGLLRAALDDNTAALVAKTVNKDLSGANEDTLQGYLE